MPQIDPKPMPRFTPKPMQKSEGKPFDIPKIEPRHDDKIDASRYFMAGPKTKRPMTLERKIVFATVGALLILTILQGIVMALNSFFGTYDVQIHPLFQAPFTIERRIKPTPEVKGAEILPIETPTPTKAPAAPQVSPQPDRVVYFIWSIETGKGTAHTGWQKTCEDIGKWNELGYGGNGFCFESKEQGFAVVTRELSARIAKNGIKETLCVYNLGYNRDEAGKRIPWDDCGYYQSYIKAL